MEKLIIIILIIILILILVCNNNENFNIKEEIEKEEKNIINLDVIKLVSNENLLIETLMIKNILKKLKLNSEIIVNVVKHQNINYLIGSLKTMMNLFQLIIKLFLQLENFLML